MKRQYLIRRYRPDDTDGMMAVFQNSVRVSASRDYSQAQVMAWAPDNLDRTTWLDRYSQRLTWIAEFDGVPVGFADLEADGHLDHIYVHSSHQRQGIATELFERIERAALDLGLPRLYTESSITARPFFDHRGFRVITPQTVLFNGEQFTNYQMEKLLGAH